MSQALLDIQSILQNTNIFCRSRETVPFTPFGDKKVLQFSGFLPTSVSYLKIHSMWQFVSKLTKFRSLCSDQKTMNLPREMQVTGDNVAPEQQIIM